MLIRGTLVTFSSLANLSIQHDHLLAISPTGQIIHNAPYSSTSSQDLISSSSDIITALPTGSFILPAFVDLHLHAPQFLYQGTGLHLPLMQWLDAYAFKAEERIDSDPELARRVYKRLAQRLLENGTGTALMFGTIKEDTNLILAQVMHEAGIRAFVGKLSMDIDIAQRPSYVEASADASLASARSFVQRCRALVPPTSLSSSSPPPIPVLTPRFVPTCSDALLAGLGALAKPSSGSDALYIQSHLAESHDQVAWVQSTHGGNPDISIFDSAALLTPRTVQAHCTYLAPGELDLMSERGAAIAHCPLSNAYFSSERPFGVGEALERGVKVGLGTDVAGGYSLDLGCAMRWAVGVARMREGAKSERGESASDALDWKGALYLATRGGAEALSILVGTFDIGSEFDAQLIQLFDPATGVGVGSLDFFDLELETDRREVNEEMVEKWWCVGDVRNRKVGMAYPQQHQPQQDIVSGDQYRYALTNFRLAHEKVEQQRRQLEEQERQVALLRERIAVLEGGPVSQRHGLSGNSVDDFSIRNAASQLDKLINRWASDIVRTPPESHEALARAALSDLIPSLDVSQIQATAMQTQNFLRHAMSETISEGIINCLIITNSSDANVQLTRIHEHIFARDPTVASVWRRQTFSAAVETCTPEMTLSILYEQVPELTKHLNSAIPTSGGSSILEHAYSFSRMLHGSGSTAGDAFYRAFVPELGSTLYPRQIELVKRCLKSERGELDRVGATIFPGLVKVSRGQQLPNGQYGENMQTVVRRAQVICECAMGGVPINVPRAQHAQMPEGLSLQNGFQIPEGMPPQNSYRLPQSLPMQNSLGFSEPLNPQDGYGGMSEEVLPNYGVRQVPTPNGYPIPGPHQAGVI